MNNITKNTLYTIGCPRCRTLEQKLKNTGIEFQTCEDIEIMHNKGFKEAPMLEIIAPDGSELTLCFSEALKYLREREVNKR